MNPPSSRPPTQPSRQRDPSATRTAEEDAFDVPPIASSEAPDGPDVTTTPGAEAGHYGPGYGDPTRHEGGDWPGKGVPMPSAPQASQPATGPDVARAAGTGPRRRRDDPSPSRGKRPDGDVGGGPQ